MTAAVAAAAGAMGLGIGSFLNVVVWRVPLGESIVSPRSACPHCGHMIRPRDNVPILSWLLLRGRCRDCAAPISARYPLVEATTAILFTIVAWSLGPQAALPAVLYFVAISIALALIDIDVRRLPDAIVLPSYPVVLVLLALASWNPGGASDWGALIRALVGATSMFLVYLALVIAYPPGMGFGDVKLAGVIGLILGWFGWGALAVGWFAAFLLGGAFSVGLLLAGRVGRKSGIPFGPWMLIGAGVGIVCGDAIWGWYGSFLS